jgi:hypothetical protein
MTPCRHRVCHAIADGTCHIDADGWVFGVTRDQQERIRIALGQPDNEFARAIRKQTDGLRELVSSLREMLAKPDLPARHRKWAERHLERLRLCGVPRDPEKETTPE